MARANVCSFHSFLSFLSFYVLFCCCSYETVEEPEEQDNLHPHFTFTGLGRGKWHTYRVSVRVYIAALGHLDTKDEEESKDWEAGPVVAITIDMVDQGGGRIGTMPGANRVGQRQR